jgi:peptide/nickel transport system permease protein
MVETIGRRVPRRLRRLAFRINMPLLIGGLLVVLLIGGAVAAPLLVQHDPSKVLAIDPANPGLRTPFPPGTPGFLFGSDPSGRDMLSRLLYGARYTLLIGASATLGRVTLGGLIGMLAGWYAGARRPLNALINAWSAIPPVFLAFFAIPLLAIPIFGISRAGPQNITQVTNDAIVFTIVLSITGWTETAVRCRTMVQGLQSAPFIEAAYAVGLGRWAVLWRHVLPNLRDVLLAEGANAMSGALLLIAELGFFSFFIGGGVEDITGSKYLDPIYAEWGSMLAKGLRQRSLGIWLLLEPLLAFTLAILAFNLLGEGLRKRR